MSEPMPKEEAIKFFAAFFNGKHHIPGKVREFGYGWYVNDHRTMATWDFDELTRMVFLAHDRCVRVEIVACNMQYLKIAIHPRVREGQIYDRHPTIEKALEQWRKYNVEVT